MENKLPKIFFTAFFVFTTVIGLTFGDSLIVVCGIGLYFCAMMLIKMSEMEY